jgi:DNA-binding transcriptional ArsR family regulator
MTKPQCCQNPRRMKEISSTADFLKMIADENRLRILCILQSGEKCVCDLWSALSLPQNLVSHHLKMLKGFNLIQSRKEGLRVYYSINQRELLKARIYLNQIFQTYESSTD